MLGSGGPVWSTAWCPLPLSVSLTEPQYLAVSSYIDCNHYKSHTVHVGPAFIEIWNCGFLQSWLDCYFYCILLCYVYYIKVMVWLDCFLYYYICFSIFTVLKNSLVRLLHNIYITFIIFLKFIKLTVLKVVVFCFVIV